MKRIETVDLFGPVVIEVPEGRSGRKPTKKNGYASPPGTGPAGETCRTCRHAVAPTDTARRYWKCWLMQRNWTGGPGTDILLRSPACRQWQANPRIGSGKRMQAKPK